MAPLPTKRRGARQNFLLSPLPVSTNVPCTKGRKRVRCYFRLRLFVRGRALGGLGVERFTGAL